MALNERVHIARRFLRPIRIDADLGDAGALEGFVCPHSSANVLLTMARHVSETGHGAFTWTGPYGSGKSSLVIALSALLNGNAGLQKEAAKVFGQKLTKAIRSAMPTGTKGWRVVPVVTARCPKGSGKTPAPSRFLVPLLAVLLDVLRNLDRQGLHEHPARPLPRELRPASAPRPALPVQPRCRVPSAWVASPSPRPASQGVCVVHAEGYAAFFTLPIHNFWLYLCHP